jgi:hypothetical protein
MPSLTRRRTAALGLAALLGLAGCGTLELSQADTVVRQADPQFAVALTLQPAQVRIGEPLAMQVRASRPGHLYVVQLGSAGRQMSLVYPNAAEPSGRRLMPDTTLSLPGPGWAFVAQGPAGVGYYVALVTEQPQDPAQLRAAIAQGRIDVEGRYGAAIATLRELER